MSSNAFFQSTDPQAFKQSRDPQARRTRGLPDGLVEVRVEVPIVGVPPFAGSGKMYWAFPRNVNEHGEWRTAPEWGGDFICGGDGSGDPCSGASGQLPRFYLEREIWKLIELDADFRSPTRYKKVTMRVETSPLCGGMNRPVPWPHWWLPDFEQITNRDWYYEFYWDDTYSAGPSRAYGMSGPPGDNFWSKVVDLTDHTITETGDPYFALLDSHAVSANRLNIAAWDTLTTAKDGWAEINMEGTGSKLVYFGEQYVKDGEDPNTIYHYYTRITVERTMGQMPIFNYDGCEVDQMRTRAHEILDSIDLQDLSKTYTQFVELGEDNATWVPTTVQFKWHWRYRITPVANNDARHITLWKVDGVDMRLLNPINASELWVLPEVAPRYQMIAKGDFDNSGIRWIYEPPMVMAYRTGFFDFSWAESKVRFKESRKWCCVVWNCQTGERRSDMSASGGLSSGRYPSAREYLGSDLEPLAHMDIPYSSAACGVNGSHYIDAGDFFTQETSSSGFMVPLRWATETYWDNGGVLQPLDPWYINVPPECGGKLQPGLERNKTADDRRPADEGYTP